MRPILIFAILLSLAAWSESARADCCRNTIQFNYFLAPGACPKDPYIETAASEKCTQPYCFDQVVKEAWRPSSPSDFTCDERPNSIQITQHQYEELMRKVGQNPQ